MKKMFLLLIGAVFVASLSHGTCSKSTAHANCAFLLQEAQPAGAGSSELVFAVDSRKDAGMARVAKTSEQNEVQGVSFPDRVLNFVDNFAELVMVI